MTKVILPYILSLMLSLSATAQTKRALVIGLGQQEDKEWNKINGDKDVPYVLGYLKKAGFKSVTTLINQKATKAGIIAGFKKMISASKPGDIVYVHYSGHGQQMKDIHNDEADGLDECWIPYDAYRFACAKDHGEKHLTDDEINFYLNAIRKKVGDKGKILVAIDACHSGDATRGEEEVVRGVEEVFQAIKAFFVKEEVANPRAQPLSERWITISACKSEQVNLEMKKPTVGKLTYALSKLLEGNPTGNNAEFMRQLKRLVDINTIGRSQHAVMTGDDINRYKIIDILKK